jgi:hypothetical protein
VIALEEVAAATAAAVLMIVEGGARVKLPGSG